MKTIDNNTFERRTTIIDIVFKSIGAIGISVPLMLFYLQTCNDKQDRKSRDLSNVFIEASMDLNKSINSSLKTETFEESNTNIRYKYNTLLSLYCDENLRHTYQIFLEAYSAFHNLKKLVFFSDSIFLYQMDMFRYYSFNLKYPYKDKDAILDKIKRFRDFTFGYSITFNKINDSLIQKLNNGTIDSVTYNKFDSLFEYNLSVNSVLDTRVLLLNNYLVDSANKEFFRIEKIYFEREFDNPEESIFYKTAAFKTINDSLYTLSKKDLLSKFELIRLRILKKICN